MPAAHMGEIRAERTTSLSAAYFMAARTTLVHEDLAPPRQEGIDRCGSGGSLACEPALELGLREHLDVKCHQGVLAAAVFGALAAMQSGLVGPQHQAIATTGNHVHLAGERWHPEAVDDIVG